MTHQDGTQKDEDVAQVAHQNFTHNLEHAESIAAKLAKHAAQAHPVAHEKHI